MIVTEFGPPIITIPMGFAGGRWDGVSLLEVPPVPSGIGGDAPEQVDWNPCGPTKLDPALRRTIADIGRGLRQINQMANFPRTGTVPPGGLWDGTTTPKTITVEDDELGHAVVVNLPAIPGKDPNLRAGDEVFFFVKGNVAQSFYEYHDDKVGTLKFWTKSYESIPAGWARADGIDNHTDNGGTGFNYIGSVFIGGHLTTAGTAVNAVNPVASGSHNHTGTLTGTAADGGAGSTSRTLVTMDPHPDHTHLVDVGDHSNHNHIVSEEDHHHHLVFGSSNHDETGGGDIPNVNTGDQVPFASDTESAPIVHTVGNESATLTHTQVTSAGSSITLDHNSLKPSTAGTIANATYYPDPPGDNTTIINFDSPPPFSEPLPVAGDIYYFSDGSFATILSGDEDTITVSGDHSSETGTGELIQGHIHLVFNHTHNVSVSIESDGSHSHIAGTPAYMTAIPIERKP